jgi:hypothetical protein
MQFKAGELIPDKPTAIAMLLALISLPFVVLTFDAVDITGGGPFYPHMVAPGSEPVQWMAAASAVFFSSLVAGTLGAIFVRRHVRAGAVATFAIAWLVAAPTLAIVPALLGGHVGAGCIEFGYGAQCAWAVTSDDLLNGVWSDAFFVLSPLIEPLPMLILAVGVAIWTHFVRRMPYEYDR